MGLEPPPINPDHNAAADGAKHYFAAATLTLARLQYRLGELAGTGRLDREESMSLQEGLFAVWEELYFGTLCAVRDWSTSDLEWDDHDNTYSDGRQVRIRLRVDPREHSEPVWEHNRFLLGDGAVAEHPLGEICYVAPVKPRAEHNASSEAVDFRHLGDWYTRFVNFCLSSPSVIVLQPDGGESGDVD